MGMIRPNIRFGAGLPADWNGRFVMRGGGGYAGQQPMKGTRRPVARSGLRHGLDRYRPRRGPLSAGDLRLRQSRRRGGLRLPRRAPHRGRGQAARRRALRPAGGVRLLAGLFHRRPAGTDVGPALPGRLRRHRGRGAGARLHEHADRRACGSRRRCGRIPVSLEKIARVGEAIYAACDHLDGLEDGLIDDPAAVRLRPRGPTTRAAARRTASTA